MFDKQLNQSVAAEKFPEIFPEKFPEKFPVKNDSEKNFKKRKKMKTIFIAHVIFIRRKIDHRCRFSEIFEKSMITNHSLYLPII